MDFDTVISSLAEYAALHDFANSSIEIVVKSIACQINFQCLM